MLARLLAMVVLASKHMPKRLLLVRNTASYTLTASVAIQTADVKHGSQQQMPARPRGLLEPCAATSSPHGSEEGVPKTAPPLSDNKLYWIRDVTFAEDHSQICTGNGPAVMATLRNSGLSRHRLNGHTNIAAACRYTSRHPLRAADLLT